MKRYSKEWATSSLASWQGSSLAERKHIPITLPKLKCLEKPLEEGDGVALTSVPTPDWLADGLAGAIKSGKLK